MRLRLRDTLKVVSLMITLTAVSVSGSGANEPFQGARALAVVGGETITVAEFEREMERRGVQRGQFADLEHRRELLDEMVRQKALEMAARRDGYAEHPEVQKILRQAMVSKYIDNHLDALLADAAVTDEEIERHYREHADEYRVAGRLRGAIILIAVPAKATPEKIAELEEKAESIREEATGADDPAFAALARRHSDDGATRYLAGNIGWITDSGRPLKWGDEVVTALFSLRSAGDIGPLVRGEKGFYVVRLTESEEARIRPLEQLRTGIAHSLLKERRNRLRDEFYAELLGELEVAQNNELLETMEPPSGDRAPLEPPPLPGGQTRERASAGTVDIAGSPQDNEAFQK